MKKGMRSSTPTGEARSARVTTMSVKQGGALGYATKGQMTLRPQAMGGKPKMSKTMGYYPNAGTRA